MTMLHCLRNVTVEFVGHVVIDFSTALARACIHPPIMSRGSIVGTPRSLDTELAGYAERYQSSARIARNRMAFVAIRLVSRGIVHFYYGILRTIAGALATR